MFVATINKTLKSYIFAIIGAEYIMRWLPIGTHDGRYHANLWCRLVCWTSVLHCSRQHRNDFLRISRVFWFGRYQTYSPRNWLWTCRRFCWHFSGYRCGLLVFRLSRKKSYLNSKNLLNFAACSTPYLNGTSRSLDSQALHLK